MTPPHIWQVKAHRWWPIHVMTNPCRGLLTEPVANDHISNGLWVGDPSVVSITQKKKRKTAYNPVWKNEKKWQPVPLWCSLSKLMKLPTKMDEILDHKNFNIKTNENLLIRKTFTFTEGNDKILSINRKQYHLSTIEGKGARVAYWTTLGIAGRQGALHLHCHGTMPCLSMRMWPVRLGLKETVPGGQERRIRQPG